MQFQVIVGIVVVASAWSVNGIQFGEFDLDSVSEYQPAEAKRDKRSLTTICVEIKPSTPYEEPYFMCKGTEMPQFSKGSSYAGGGSQSSDYSSKSKPSVSYGEGDSYHSGVKSDYDGPVKTDYHTEQSKYTKPSAYESHSHYSEPTKPSYNKKPSYSDHGSHSTYSSYEASKSSYGAKPYADHDSYDAYSKPQVHKPIYEKPSSHYEPTHSSKLQPHSQESSSYGHSEPSQYSKPSSYEHSSSYSSKPSHSEVHSKPSYGHSGPYSASPESKPGYSKPSSYSAHPTSYEHSDHLSYGHSKPSYSEPSSIKSYSKSTHDHPASYSKPVYSSNEYSKPVKSYATSEKGYDHVPSKPVYSSQTHSYRSMSDDMTQPMWDTMWDTQSPAIPVDGFGYRAMGIPIDHHNFETQRMMDPEYQQYLSLDGPVKLELSANEREAPILQAAYPYSSPTASYAPAIPSYSAAVPYAQVAPNYAPAAPAYTPSYAAVPPSYVPVAPSYASATPSYSPVSASASYSPDAPSNTYGSAIQSYLHPTQVYKPACPATYLYTFQPAIVTLPCHSSQHGYGQPVYSQSLGAPINSNLAATHQFYPSNINPLQDHSSVRSEGNSESSKHIDDTSTSEESQEADIKKHTASETSLTNPLKSDVPKKTEVPEEKPAENKTQNHETGPDKLKEDQSIVGAGPKGTEGTGTKQAYLAMMKMAKIAAQLSKDDPNHEGNAGPPVPGSEKPSSAPTQFLRQK